MKKDNNNLSMNKQLVTFVALTLIIVIVLGFIFQYILPKAIIGPSKLGSSSLNSDSRGVAFGPGDEYYWSGDCQTCCMQGEVCNPEIGECEGGGGKTPDLQACCSGGTCEEFDPIVCTALGGEPLGPGTNCDNPNTCVQNNLNACCKIEGCEMKTPLECIIEGGVPTADSSCAEADICINQACCIIGGGCSDVPIGPCVIDNGLPQGIGTTCNDALIECPTSPAQCESDDDCTELGHICTDGVCGPACGNGVIDEGEQCDFGGGIIICPYPSVCNSECQCEEAEPESR